MSLYRSFQCWVQWCKSSYFYPAQFKPWYPILLHQCMWYMGAKMFHSVYLYHVLCMSFGDLLSCTNAHLFIYRGKCLMCSCSTDFLHLSHGHCQYITNSCMIQSLRNVILKANVKIEWMDLMLATNLPFLSLMLPHSSLTEILLSPQLGWGSHLRWESSLLLFSCFCRNILCCIHKLPAKLSYLCDTFYWK